MVANEQQRHPGAVRWRAQGGKARAVPNAGRARCAGAGVWPRPRIASQANYSSACGAHNRAYYAPLEGRTNTVVLIGAVHAQETEGVAAIANLISLLETGKDLAGGENPGLLRAAEGLRVVLVPIANPDGRARVEPDRHGGAFLGGTAPLGPGQLGGWLPVRLAGMQGRATPCGARAFWAATLTTRASI